MPFGAGVGAGLGRFRGTLEDIVTGLDLGLVLLDAFLSCTPWVCIFVADILFCGASVLVLELEEVFDIARVGSLTHAFSATCDVPEGGGC